MRKGNLFFCYEPNINDDENIGKIMTSVASHGNYVYSETSSFLKYSCRVIDKKLYGKLIEKYDINEIESFLKDVILFRLNRQQTYLKSNSFGLIDYMENWLTVFYEEFDFNSKYSFSNNEIITLLRCFKPCFMKAIKKNKKKSNQP